ncbi:hypothetical protein GQX74_014512 [Glossina fuscipes]|nr:hypothetical protein GQX74_014512 [Glossina fuscipes]
MALSKSDVEDGKVNSEKSEILLQNVSNDGRFQNSSEKLQSDLDDSISKDKFMTPEKFLNRTKEATPHQVSRQPIKPNVKSRIQKRISPYNTRLRSQLKAKDDLIKICLSTDVIIRGGKRKLGQKSSIQKGEMYERKLCNKVDQGLSLSELPTEVLVVDN